MHPVQAADRTRAPKATHLELSLVLLCHREGGQGPVFRPSNHGAGPDTLTVRPVAVSEVMGGTQVSVVDGS